MSDIDKKEEYPVVRWLALSTKRKSELKILLSTLHREEVLSGRASLGVAIKMVRRAIEEAHSKSIGAAEEWDAWADEQAAMSRRVELTETYKVLKEHAEPGTKITGGMRMILEHTLVSVGLPPGELDPAIPDASLPESPACYYHHLCVAACEWISLNRASKPMRGVTLPGIEKLPRHLHIMRDDDKAERRYNVLRLMTELTLGDNPPRAVRASKKAHQIPTAALEIIEDKLRVPSSTARDMLKDMEFQYLSKFLRTVTKL